MISLKLSENWSYPREKAACFTGHRPEKLKGKADDYTTAPPYILSFLRKNIEAALNEGYKVFYNGLARGVDLWAAEILLEYKNSFPELCLIGVQPYPDHGRHFSEPFGSIFNRIYNESDLILCSSSYYHKGTYLIRDRYMVDHSSRIIGVYDSAQKKSGTYYTISYAKQQNLKCSLLDLNEENQAEV